MLIHFEVPTRSFREFEYLTPTIMRGRLPVDVLETQNGTVIYAELPGVGKDDITLTVEEDVLTIAGSRRAVELPEGGRFLLKEQRTHNFERRIAVSHPVDARSMTASLENGLLRVELPKAEAARSRTIEIR
jgi:HSP20 family protein